MLADDTEGFPEEEADMRSHEERLSWIAVVVAVLALVLVLPLTACAPADDAEAGAAETAEEEPGVSTSIDVKEPGPRVFFVEPEYGEIVPAGVVKLKFGAENFIIEPVGDGEIHEGAGHYHLGINAECLDPGVIIPTADPWIHFGDGSSEIEIELTPGVTMLCLQVGDGEHRTLAGEGLTDVITITVEE